MKLYYLKQKLPALLVICLLLITKAGSAQTGILVKYYDGSEQTYSIETSGKIYFDNSNLLVAVNSNASVTSIPLSIIRRITFSYAVLPVTLLEFTARNNQASVDLYWKTGSEINASHFIVERSADGLQYEAIGQVAALNSSNGGSYSYTDVNPLNGINYYRLKEVDINGSYTYSEVVTVTREAYTNIVIAPNPASDYFKISSSSQEVLKLAIYTTAGQQVTAGSYRSGDQVNISKLSPGMYIVIINSKAYKLIKQ
ncbi:MAG: T9SS type A sorting domain-containing protein [Ferruginibacter sp.]